MKQRARCRSLRERDLNGFVRSKADAVDPQIARNQNYDDHYADDSEDVHSAALTLKKGGGARCARTPRVPPPLIRWRHCVIASQASAGQIIANACIPSIR